MSLLKPLFPDALQHSMNFWGDWDGMEVEWTCLCDAWNAVLCWAKQKSHSIFFFEVDLGNTVLVVTQGSSSLVLTFPSLTTFNKGNVSWDGGGCSINR